MPLKSLVCLILTSLTAVSQIQPQPVQYKKIHFTYQTKSRYHFTEQGVYADTLLFARHFPEMTIQRVKSPIDTTKTVGFIAKSRISPKQMSELSSILYHTNSTTHFVYDVRKNCTETTTEMAMDESTEKVFKTFFGRADFTGQTAFPTTIRYKDGKNYIGNSIHTSIVTTAPLEWTDAQKTSGILYVKHKDEDELTPHIYYFNSNLDVHITPTFRFPNSENGVQRIVSLNFITTLVSVRYE